MEKTYNDIFKLLEDLNIFDDKIIKLFKDILSDKMIQK